MMIHASDVWTAARRGTGDVVHALAKDHPDNERLDTLAKSAGLMVIGRISMILSGMIVSVGVPALVAVLWLMNANVAQHTTDLANLKNEFTERKAFGDNERLSIVGKLDDLTNRISALSQAAAAATVAAAGVQREVDANHLDSRDQIADLQKQIASIQTQVNVINDRLGPIIFDISRVKAQVLCHGKSEC